MPTPPTLASAFEDGNSSAVLTFAWADFAPTSGLTRTGYKATLYADAARTGVVSGGATQSVSTASATFVVPRSSPFILDVQAVDTNGTLGPTTSLLAASPGGVLPGQPLPASSGDGLSEADDADAGVLAPLRPCYGTVDGVRRWARVVTFGTGKGQVSPVDVLYFLMCASDEADMLFSARYAVPLTRYRDPATGLWRYPPGLGPLIERKAAGLLLYARKAALTESESGTAVGLLTYADRMIGQMASGGYLAGQTMGVGMLPRVSNPVPRQFSMPGDVAGAQFSPTVGSTDVRFLRPHGLPYQGVAWRYFGQDGAAGVLIDGN